MNVNEPFELYPLIGAGKLKFGMTPEMVEHELGKPESTSKNFKKERIDSFSFMSTGYLVDSHVLYHIGFGRQMTAITYQGINFFQDNPDKVIDQLMQYDNSPYLHLGFIVFLKLGLTLTGFHDGDTDQKAITVFDKKPWNDWVGKMKRYYR